MREKLRDLSVAEIPNTDWYIRLSYHGRYGKEYEHIERYNEYQAEILRSDGEPGVWELPDLDACCLSDAKENLQELAELFGFEGELEWQDAPG